MVKPVPTSSSKTSPPKLNKEETERLVEVALVEVERTEVKLDKVEEASVRSPPVEFTEKRVEPGASRNLRKFPVKEVVEEATIRSPVVEVALTWKYELLAMEFEVVAPT